jgi:hypothetical protein
VSLPGAAFITITFDDQSRTESGYVPRQPESLCHLGLTLLPLRSYDFLQFRSPTGALWGEEKYSGGYNGSAKRFPGIGGLEPLVIDGDSFTVVWHSDGSNNECRFLLQLFSP